MSLEIYHKKRDFKKTIEPKGHQRTPKKEKNSYVIQKHAASHLHYDFRLELDGVLKSWAVPKGPCYDPNVKCLAVQVEDHPIEYGDFEGIIPQGEYGGGIVMLWDRGTWDGLDDDSAKALEEGHLRFKLRGIKLKGRWDLIRFKKDKEWFLIKYQDEEAKKLVDYDVTLAEPLSVSSKMEDITKTRRRENISEKGDKTSISLTNLNLSKTSFPRQTPFQLATLVDKPPQGSEWLHEIKFDGYRMMALKQGKTVTLITRNGHDWSSKFPSLVKDIKKLAVQNVILDGEIVVLDESGCSNFQLLQNRLKGDNSTSFTFYLFDLLYFEHYDLQDLPLIERKNFLELILNQAPPSLRFSAHILNQGDEVFKNSCEFSLEGIVSKKIDSLYEGKRSINWLKIKCSQRQEFIVGGFTKPRGTRNYFGALLLGVYNNKNELAYSGNVGTGFNQDSLKEIYQCLEKYPSNKNPFNSVPPGEKLVTWVEPKLVIEVEFSEKTRDGRLRHPSFKGIRMDKKPLEVLEEKEEHVEKIRAPESTIILTHPEKVLYKEDKITKQELYDYYDKISTYILPYISNRLLTLMRCPSSYTDCFYQKHLNQLAREGLKIMPVKNKKGDSESYLYLNDKAGLLSLVQMGVLEIHPWGSTVDNLECPDIITFDLDPSPELPWKKVVEAAFEIKAHLEQFQLNSFVKTTGGKGLHLVIPIQADYSWEIIKNFTHTFVEFLEKRNPEKYISKMSKAKRKGKIFVDYLRNQRDATAIAPYSTRARLHAPVSTPLHWDELTPNFNDSFYTLETLPKRLVQLKKDPWEDFWVLKQSLSILDSFNKP